MDKVLPAQLKDLPQTQWISLSQGWYLGMRYDGFVVLAHTNGLQPEDPKSSVSICQLTPEDFTKALEKLGEMRMKLL